MPRRYARRSYGGRRVRRRGRVGRRSVKRRSYGRRHKMSIGKRSGPVKAAARAASQTYTTTPMCKDLGKLWPECMVVKLPVHAVMQMNPAGTTASLSAAGAYNFSLQYYPCVTAGQGLFGASSATNFTPAFSDASASGFSAPTTGAQGWARMIAAAGATTAPYSQCCVLRAKGSVSLSLAFPFRGVVGTTIASGPSPGVHFRHDVNQSDSFYVAPTTAGTVDSFWNQPDVQRKYHPGWGSGGTSVGGTITSTAFKFPVVRWPIDIMPHKLLRMGFSEYVSDSRSFGQVTVKPTQCASTQFAGFFIPPSDATGQIGQVPTVGMFHVSLIFTCLFKDIAGSVT